MNAQILESYNTPYEFKTVDVPQVSSEHDILVKVDAAGYDTNLDACMWMLRLTSTTHPAIAIPTLYWLPGK